MLETIYTMKVIFTEKEIGEIEDVIGRLGDVEDGQHNAWIAEECAEQLFALIKPFILDDIKNNDNLDHIQVVGNEHL